MKIYIKVQGVVFKDESSIDEQPAELSKFQLEKVKGTVFKTELSIGRLAKVER